jgi:hypothetical protein
MSPHPQTNASITINRTTGDRAYGFSVNLPRHGLESRARWRAVARWLLARSIGDDRLWRHPQNQIGQGRQMQSGESPRQEITGNWQLVRAGRAD